MAPEPNPREEGGPVGTIITGHKIALNVQYESEEISDKLGGKVTPVEEKVANTGALQICPNQIKGISNAKVTHLDDEYETVQAPKFHTEETEHESLHSSLYSASTLTEARPETPETESAHSEEDLSTPMIKECLKQQIVPKKEYLKGPDQVIPSENIKTWEPTGSVKLRIGKKGMSALKPLSIPTFLKNTVKKFPSHTALSIKREGKQVNFTYSEYYETIRVVAKAFIKLGLDMYHGVCIMGFNSPEWFISDLAAVFAGGFAAGLYTTNTPEACQHCAVNCKAQIWVVEDGKQLEKVLKIKHNLPHLKTIIQYIGKPTVEGVMSWNDVIELGKKLKDTDLEERLKRIAVNQCSTLIYTSGTTGAPKGVMLSHDNITFTAAANALNIDMRESKEVIVSYLPLSHVAAQMADIYLSMYMAGTVIFAQPDALKGTLVNTLKEARPTRFLGVPRVWEKMYERMMDVGRKTTGLKKCIATWAKSVGTETNLRRQDKNFNKPYGYAVANGIVFKKIKAALGLDHCLLFLSGAAPISQDIVRYFHSLDITLTEIYGMSESTGPHTICVPTSFKVGSVGQTVPGCYTHILEPDHEGNGEVCMGGRNVCMGYLLMEDKTHEAIDDDGLLHSGDIGKLDQEGYLFITGRIKELIITAGGENIPPVLIEDVLKAELPCISNAMLIGDRRKFLSMLLTVKTNVDSDGEPLDTLAPGTIEWCRSVGSSASTIQDILVPDEAFMRAIQAGVDRTNKQAASNAQKIQKWTILPRDFTVSGEELGPTLKLKRPVVAKKYHDTIEKFYS